MEKSHEIRSVTHTLRYRERAGFYNTVYATCDKDDTMTFLKEHHRREEGTQMLVCLNRSEENVISCLVIETTIVIWKPLKKLDKAV